MKVNYGVGKALWALAVGLSCVLAESSTGHAQEREIASNRDTQIPAGFPEGVEEADRIVAVVGDTAILLSELEIRLFELQSQGARIPQRDTPEWTDFARQVLVAEIDNIILLQQAKRAGLTPDAGRVDQMVEDEYQRRRQQFATDEEMMQAVEAAGMNMLQYRQMLRRASEAESLFMEYRFSLEQRTDLTPVLVTESEMQAFFEERQGDPQLRPALISFNQLVVTPSPSGEARDSSLARTIRIRSELAFGEEDFEVVARRHSDDEQTRERGGELGWMSRQTVVKPFGDAVWAARPGQTLPPVQTQFGIHIIKIERQRGAERFLRHILIRPEIRDVDVDSAYSVAEQIADSLRAGVDPERLTALFRGDVADEDIRFDDVPINRLTDRFMSEVSRAFENIVPGQVYGPLELERGGPKEFALIQVVTYRPEGPLEFDDVRDQIRQTIRQTKQLDILLSEIRSNTFIDVKL